MRYKRSASDVLRDLDLDIGRGEIFALLGPNGAGKTTALEILEGHRLRTAGEVVVLGQDPAHADPSWRARCGVVLQDSVPEPELTVREVLSLYRGFYPQPFTVDAVLDLVDLQDQASTRTERLSGGQRRRLDVALGVIGNPELLFLDEPTTGFDPSARRATWAAVRALRNQGMTVVLTTHYLDEAEALADRVAVIVDGRIVAEGTPRDLGGRDRQPTSIQLSVTGSLPALPRELAPRGELTGPGALAVQTASPIRDLGVLCRWIERNHLVVDDVSVSRPTLEDTYIRLIGADR